MRAREGAEVLQGECMTNSEEAAFMLDFRMIKIGAIVAGAGMMVAAAGSGLIGLALTRATRQWMARKEVSPSTMAADRMRQARHASMAGAQAWRSYQMTSANGVGARR